MLRHLWLSAPNRLWSLTVIRAGQNGGVTGNTPIRLTLRNSPTILPIKLYPSDLQSSYHLSLSTIKNGFLVQLVVPEMVPVSGSFFRALLHE